MRLCTYEGWVVVRALYVKVCLHDTTGCQSGCTTGFTTGWMFVYTMQPVVQPTVQLNNRLSNRFDNRLNVCVHDTTCCPTGCQTDNVRLTEYVVKRITVIEFGVNDKYRDKIAVSTYDYEKPNHNT